MKIFMLFSKMPPKASRDELISMYDIEGLLTGNRGLGALAGQALTRTFEHSTEQWGIASRAYGRVLIRLLGALFVVHDRFESVRALHHEDEETSRILEDVTRNDT